MLSLVVTTRPGSGRSSCRSPQKVEREKEEARHERDGEEEEEKEQVEEEGEGERERNARQSLPRFFSRDRSRSAHERNINFESDRWIRSAVPSLRDRSETGSSRELLFSLRRYLAADIDGRFVMIATI